uniref:Uncharacterized protein n=1 Tax=Romanomermis culicivorax TaxID=13658 RepID=A0A915J0B8_ROMCU
MLCQIFIQDSTFKKWWQCWDSGNVGTVAMLGWWQCWGGGSVETVAMLGLHQWKAVIVNHAGFNVQ